MILQQVCYFSFKSFIVTELFILTGTLLNNRTFAVVSCKKDWSRLNLSLCNHFIGEVEEIIIFVEGNRFHVGLKVGERGK
jgi:hypothetical protein